MSREFTGLFIAEGSSDMPLSSIVENLFFDEGVDVTLSTPDFSLIDNVGKDVYSRVIAGRKLLGHSVDVIVVHRDCDNAGSDTRRNEIESALEQASFTASLVPVIPVRMTEAWLILDESAIRRVAGNPTGRVPLDIPKAQKAESIADPKQTLKEMLLTAADVRGRRRDRVSARFDQSRRQLLEGLDRNGQIVHLASWKALLSDVKRVAADLR